MSTTAKATSDKARPGGFYEGGAFGYEQDR